jgi:hypothetical protein
MKGEPSGNVLRGIGDQREKEDQSEREQREPLKFMGCGMRGNVYLLSFVSILEARHEFGALH